VNFHDQEELDNQAARAAEEQGPAEDQPTLQSPSASGNQPPGPARSLEQLVQGMRDQLVELRFKIDALPQGAAAAPGAPQVAALRGELSAHGDQLAQLTAGLAEHREELDRREASLVGRIADLDDDRRAGATMMQRAWESHREDINARLRRGSRQTALGLALVVLILLGGLFLVYWKVGLDRAPLANEVAKLKESMGRGPQVSNIDSQMESKLNQLAVTVKGISDSLKASAKPQPDLMTALAKERADRSKAEARLADALHSLEARQRALSSGIAAGAAVAPTEATSAQPAKAAQAAAQSPGHETGAAKPAAPTAKPSSPETAATVEHPTGASPTPAPEASAGQQPAAGPEEPAAAVQGPLVLKDPSYLVQLIGLHGLDDVERFSTRPGLPPTVYYMKQGSGAHPIYVVIHSVHDTHAAAQAAKSALPTDFARLRPFVRSVPAGAELWPCHSGKCARPAS
jgi:DamX protein